MVKYKNITGTLIQSYYICKRQLWLMSRQIVPDQEHPFIEVGRLIDQESYRRDKKKIHFENIVLDFLRSEEHDLVIGEVKKSSKAQTGARMQLAYYLYRLKENGIFARGLLSFPEERKRVPVELTPELERELEKVFAEIEQIVFRNLPPPAAKTGYCKNCGYREFCWS